MSVTCWYPWNLMIGVCCIVANCSAPKAIWNLFIPGHCTRTILVIELLCGVGNEMILRASRSWSWTELCSLYIQHLQDKSPSCGHGWLGVQFRRVQIYNRSSTLFCQVFSPFCLVLNPQLKHYQTLSQIFWAMTIRVFRMFGVLIFFFSSSGQILSATWE